MRKLQGKTGSVSLIWILIVAFVILFAIHIFRSRMGSGVAVGQPVGDLTFTEWVNGEQMSAEQLKDKVVVLEFWATWCPPCRKSIPHMKELENKFADKGVVILAVSIDNGSGVVKEMVNDKQINYRVVMDNGLSDKLNIPGVPTAFVIGQDATILWSGHPMDSAFEAAIEKAI